MNLLRVKCWKQGLVYSRFNGGSKDEFFTQCSMLGARMSLLLVDCSDQRRVYFGLNALIKDEFTPG